jgi:putative hydroxymethylpyrimidine transport system ATP-binding protein
VRLHQNPDAHPLPAPAVQVEAAHVEYDGEIIIDDLSLTLSAGQWTCLLGPSGVGKTTLLRVIAGLVDDDLCHAHVSCDDMQPLAGRFAWMSQQDLLLPWLTVVDNVLIGPRLRGETVDSALHDQARAILADLGLADDGDALPAELSGGMRQRAALARTLFEDAAVVLMDEPFSALDVITRHRLQTLAADRLAGRTVLLITHDPMEALRLGHAVYVLQGRPARLGEVMHPGGVPPRAADRDDVLHQYAQLLERLDMAAAVQ